MTRSFACGWAIALFYLTTDPGYAQQTRQGNYWLGVGLGKSQFPSGMIALGYEFVNKPTLLIARYTVNRELFSKKALGMIAQEFALLYGIRTGKFRFSTGISNVWGTSRGTYLGPIDKPFISNKKNGSYGKEDRPDSCLCDKFFL